MVNVQPLAAGDPDRVGDYEVTGRLGEGGQGVVYRARGYAGPVAIKLLHSWLIGDERARRRFVREVEVTKRVARFCTAQVLSAGVAEGGRPYIASEYVPGPSLHRQLREEGPRRGAALDRLAINTVTALAAIHQAEVVHRDFKPANVLMGPDGPVVIDFGIARALDASGTVAGGVSQVVGTPAFMAPEQLAEGVIGPHTDMFAWAVTMVFAAGGVPAFGDRSIPQVINRILHDEPDLGDLDGRLRPAVAACLSKDPAGRPTARDLMDELMGHHAPSPSPSPSPSAVGASARSEAASGGVAPGGVASVASASGVSTSGVSTSGGAASGAQSSGTAVRRKSTGRPPTESDAPGSEALGSEASGKEAPSNEALEKPPGNEPPGNEPPGSSKGSRAPGSKTRGNGARANGAAGSARRSPTAPQPPTGATDSREQAEARTVHLPSTRVSRAALAPAASASTTGPPGRRKGRTPLIIAAMAAVAVALIAGIGALASAKDNGTDQRAAAPPTQHANHPAERRAPSPSHAPTRHRAIAKPVRANPYTPQGLCGGGYRVIAVHPLGGAKTYLLYSARTGANCVVTMVPRSRGKVFLSASLVVQGGGRAIRSGSFPFYAGPVRQPARGKCVMWGGASKSASWTSAWSHCGG